MKTAFLKWWALPVIGATILVTPSYALIDADSDGMSDVWEQQHGFATSGSQPSNQLPAADYDGDGWTNLEESQAGTDPKSGLPPSGIVRPTVLRHPDFPTVFTVSWPSMLGKEYTLFVSPDLSSGSWVSVDDPVMGTGQIIEYAMEPLDEDGAPTERLFWKVVIGDVDSDIDGLNDHEEFLLGTDPHKTDSDDDGLTDGVELEFALDPNNSDSDEDGTQDGQESIDPQWISASRDLGYHCNARDLNWSDTTDSYEEVLTGSLELSGGWAGAPSTSVAFSLPPSYPQLAAAFDDPQNGVPWPDPLPDDSEGSIFSAGGAVETLTIGNFDPGGGGGGGSGDPLPSLTHRTTDYEGQLSHRRCLVRLVRPADRALTFRSVIQTKRTINGFDLPDQYTEQSVTVAEGERDSSPADLVPSFSGGGDDIENYTETVQQTLIRMFPQEVAFDGDHYHELKSDDKTKTYAAPHWVDVDGDGSAKTGNVEGEKNYPVAFTRGSQIQVKAKFKLVGFEGSEQIHVSGIGPGFSLEEQAITVGEGGVVSYPVTTSTGGVADHVEFYNAEDESAFVIQWKVRFGDDPTPRMLATTKHTVYITFADPIDKDKPEGLRHRQETLYNIGCRRAKGMDSNANNQMADAIMQSS